MPDPPSVNLITRYVFENPCPFGLALVVISIALGWTGLREGIQARTNVAAAIGGVGIFVLLSGFLVTTSGEHASRLTRQLVDAAVTGDTHEALACFSDDVTITVGSPQNPGYGYDFIQERLSRLHDQYTIESNRISELSAYSESSDAAVVHLACWTTVGHFPYPTSSKWVLRIERQTDDRWKIVRMTCVSINDRQPPSQLW